jgi:small subunit ribosomal protein S4
MIIGPKYKIARRLGAPIFEKTQKAKFSMTKGTGKKEGAPRPKAKSEFGRQLIEKQKARFTYGVSEAQFSKYVKNIINKKVLKANEALFNCLETRLDNVIYKIGLANTRRFARQIASHGHILVNGTKVTIPSYTVSKGDVLTIREGSLKKPIFATIDEKIKDITAPAWIAADTAKKAWTIQGEPKLEGESMLFDLGSVFEYYRR